MSSAYCDILNSKLLIFMPFIVLFFSYLCCKEFSTNHTKVWREGVALTTSTLYDKKEDRCPDADTAENIFL